MADEDASIQASNAADSKSDVRVLLGLSGGGYRAAVFHLGLLKRLEECNLLGSVDTISSVSGGSLLAGVLAQQQSGATLNCHALQKAGRAVVVNCLTADLRSVPLVSFWFVYSLLATVAAVLGVWLLQALGPDFDAALARSGAVGNGIYIGLIFAAYLAGQFFNSVRFRALLIATALIAVHHFGVGTSLPFVGIAGATWCALVFIQRQWRLRPKWGAAVSVLALAAQFVTLFSSALEPMLRREPPAIWPGVLEGIYGWWRVVFAVLCAASILWLIVKAATYLIERFSASQNILLARYYERSFLTELEPNKTPFANVLTRFLYTVRLLLEIVRDWFKARREPQNDHPKRPLSRPLNELPTSPRYVFNATLLNVGYPWQMTCDRVGNPRIGLYTGKSPDQSPHQTGNPLQLPISEAVAISACFPPLFTPRRFPLADRFAQFEVIKKQENAPHISERFTDEVRRTVFREVWLNDGGNFDNLGVDPLLERYAELKLKNSDANLVMLVSDAGSDPLPTGRVNKFLLPLAYLGLVFRESRRQRVELLRTLFREKLVKGSYVGVGNRIGTSEVNLLNAEGSNFKVFSDAAIDTIARIRTDLAPMKPVEIVALIRHGYLCACVQLAKLQIGEHSLVNTEAASNFYQSNNEFGAVNDSKMSVAFALSQADLYT